MILCLKAEKYCNIRLLKFPFNIKKYWKHILSSSFFFVFFGFLISSGQSAVFVSY